MTQEEKDLLLKDLCARLPYGVKAEKYTIRIDGEFVPLIDVEIITAEDIITLNGCPGYMIKPYLYPLSSMTEKQIFEINEILGGDFEIDKYGITDLIRNRRTSLSYLELGALFEYFNKNHFDYRCLIERGSANDATGKNIY